MFKKYNLLFFIACFGAGQALFAQNVPSLNQAAPSGNVTVIPLPAEIGNNLSDRSTVTHYRPKVKLTDPNSIENASSSQVDKAVRFIDGNSHCYQSIILNHSRNKVSQLKDLVQPINTAVTRDKYSFLPLPRNAGSGFQVNAFSAEKSYYQSKYASEGYTSYSARRYVSAAGYREARSFAPGKSQVGQNRYTAERTISNNANQVRIWTLDANGYPVSTAYYPANTLSGMQATDPEGHKVISYKDKAGQLVLKQVQDGTSSFASTCYVYDDLGRLVYTLSPKAVAASGNGTVSTSVRARLCFHYGYDEKGRLETTYKPGENGGLSGEIVYDRWQRPVMSRTPLEKNAGQWEVTFYDHSGRVIATALYSNSNTRDNWQNVFDNYSGATYSLNNLKYYLASDAGMGQYPPETGISDVTMMSYTWYDDYSVVDPNNAVYNNLVSALNFTPDLQSTPGAETPARSLLTQGLVTGTKVRILPAPSVDTATTGDWTQTWNYYDDKDRLIYVESKDLYHNNLLHDHRLATQYDFSGKVLISKHIQVNNKSKDGVLNHTELTRYTYDNVTGQLKDSYHKVDGGAWTILAQYAYDDLGRVGREILGDDGETRDYDYNIRGQLAGINKEYAETGYKGIENKTFGESLKYDFGFTNPQYDGNVSGMVWRGSGGVDEKALAYGYTYDPAGRLITADFREGQYQNGLTMTPTTWDKDTMDYTVSGLSYDKNSNILSKNMRGPGFTANNVPVPATIDQLNYTYTDGGNRLAAVTDAITQDYGDGDFQDGNTSGNDYTYDADGNLAQDLNKGISSVTYTYFDKPQTITFSNGSYIRYSYTASGEKIQELLRAGNNNKKTDYIGNFVYQNDSLKYVSTAVGRSVWDNADAKEEYFVKDHLGNVRSIIDIFHYPILAYLASYEIASAQLEELFFDDVDGIRDDKPGSTGPEDVMAGRLNGAEPGHQVGTSILVKVMAGDKVQINADNYYDGTYNPDNDRPVDAETMLSSIVSTLTGGQGGVGESESHAPELVPKLFNPENYLEADDMMHSDADPDRPKAFLNYVLFDQNMRLVRTFTGAWQANGDGGWQTIGNDEAMTIPVNGYLAVYLSNASSFAQCEGCLNSEGDVYFDKLHIQFIRGHLKQESHYYPFGLPMVAMGSNAVGATANRQKYQSNEYITDAGLNWMSFGARQYDPQLGRFLSVDPLAAEGGQDMLSPYQAMGNNPVRYIDPDGLLIQIKSDIHDEDLLAFLNSWLGKDNYGFDDDNNLTIKAGHEDDASGKLEDYYIDWMTQAAGGGGNISKSAAEQIAKDAAGYAKSVMSDINGDGQNVLYDDGNGRYDVGVRGKIADVGITGEKMAHFAPQYTSEFNGFWGQAKWWWTGGISGKGRYNSDGKLVGLRPIMGTPPLEGSFNGINLIKGIKSIESVEDLLQQAGKLTKLAKGVKQGIIQGNAEELYQSLIKGGEQIRGNLYKLEDGTYINFHNSTHTGIPTIDINKEGLIYKIRIQR